MSEAPGIRNAEVNSRPNSMARAGASLSAPLPDLPMEGLIGVGLTLGGGYIAGMFGVPWLGLVLGLGGFLVQRYA